MVKSLSEYLREAQASGLYRPPAAATAPQHRDVFGDLSAVNAQADESQFTPLTPIKAAIDILSRPERGVLNVIKGTAGRQAAASDGKAGDGGNPLSDFWNGLTAAEGTPMAASQLGDDLEAIKYRNVPGWKPEEHDLGDGVQGLAEDILLDPLTYLTGGLVKLVGLGGKAALGGIRAARETAAASKAAPAVVKAAEEAAPVAEDTTAAARRSEMDEAFSAEDMLSDTPRNVSEGADRLHSPAENVSDSANGPSAAFMEGFNSGPDLSTPMSNFFREVQRGVDVPAPKTVTPTEALSDLGKADRETVLKVSDDAIPEASSTRAGQMAALRGAATAIARSPMAEKARPFLQELQRAREVGVPVQATARADRVALLRAWVQTRTPEDLARPILPAVADTRYAGSLKARPLREWLQRRTDAITKLRANPTDEGLREAYEDADKAVNQAFDASEIGARYQASVKAEVATLKPVDSYRQAINEIPEGRDTLRDVLPPGVVNILERTIWEDGPKFESLVKSVIDAVGVRPSAHRMLRMDAGLRKTLLTNAGITGGARAQVIDTVADILRMEELTRADQRLGSTFKNVWAAWAREHLKVRDYDFKTFSGAKVNVPKGVTGKAVYADEINLFSQYDRARKINRYYFKGAGEPEFTKFVEEARGLKNAGTGRITRKPSESGKVFGAERDRLRLEFLIKKYRELDEIDDAAGFRSQLVVGPVDRPAALEEFADRIPLSIGDVYEALYKTARGTDLEKTMYATIGAYKTSVPITPLMIGVVARLRGEGDELVKAALADTRKYGERGLIPGSKGALENNLADEAGLLRVIDNAMPVLKQQMADNAAAYAARATDEIDYLSSTVVQRLEEIVENGTDGDLMEAVLRSRDNVAREASARMTFDASRVASEKLVDGMAAIGGRQLAPAARQLSMISRAIDESIVNAMMNIQRGSNSFGLLAKHGGIRRATPYVPPTDAEIRRAVRSLAQEGHTVGVARQQVIGRGRVANKDRHDPTILARVREQRAAEAAKAPQPEPDLMTPKQEAAVRESAALDADRATRDAQTASADDVIEQFQQEAQVVKEQHLQYLREAEAALDSGDAAVATQVLERTAEYVDLVGRSSDGMAGATTGRLMDGFGRRFIKDWNMKDLYGSLFARQNQAGVFVVWKKKQLEQIAKLAGVVRNGAVRGSVLPTAWSNVQRGVPATDAAMAEIQHGFEDVLSDILPTNSTEWIGSAFFRNSQKVDELNEVLRANGLRPSDLGSVDAAPFDWARAVERAREVKSSPAEELIQQWRRWDVADPITTLSKLAQAAADLNMRKAIAADFHSLAKAANVASDVSKPGFVKIIASGKGSQFGGFLDSSKFYRRDWAEQLRVADETLRQPRQVQNELVRRYYIPALNAWKWSITLPRPGHHIRNMIGDWSIQMVARGVRHFAQAQTDAARILASHAKYDGVDIMATFERRPGDAGRVTANGRDVLFDDGVLKGYTLDDAFADLTSQGLRPSFHAAEGLFEDVESKGTFARVMDKATLIKNTKVGDAIGTFTEYRDHYARAGHFMQALRQEAAKGTYKSRQALIDAAGAEVRKYHPDSTMLTPFEARYMRLIFPFYSWFRGVLPAIAESSVRHPDRVMAITKVNYNLAVANGLDPESFANPFPTDQMFPDFIQQQMTGPQFQLPTGEYISYSPGIAHLDVFNTLAGGDPAAGARGILGMISPIIRVPAELAGNTRWSTGQPIKDMSDYVDSNIPGINYAANISGVSPSGSVVSTLMGKGLDPQEQVARGVKGPLDQGLSLFGWLSGVSAQNLSRSNYQHLAEIQQRDRAGGDG